ncbi:MAG: putative ABC transporter permease [Bifidobacterium sp.]|jgi:uncharacterized membrane protein|nr:putative ABC transporter permease [Bifidobacterium sp.]MCH4175435.1 putative ABC transporter permease [Bifidobacterium sp.]
MTVQAGTPLQRVRETARHSVISDSTAMPLRRQVLSLFWMFIFGSIAGYGIEVLWVGFSQGLWMNRSSLVWGPFSLVYGLGLVALQLLTRYLAGRNMLTCFVACSVVGTAVEFLVSYFQDLWLGSTSWDYSNDVLNLDGRISLKMGLIWGVLGFFYILVSVPLFRFISLIGVRIGISRITADRGWIMPAATSLVAMFMCINGLVTCLAITRWQERQEDFGLTSTAASTATARILDSHFDDARMKNLFPTMVFAHGRAGTSSDNTSARAHSN